MSIESMIDGKGILCDIYKLTKGKDGQGGRTETYTLRKSDVPCFIWLLTGQQGVVGGREGIVATHKFAFKNDAVVANTDQIRVTRDNVGVSGTTVSTYDDLFSLDPNDFGHHFEIMATVRT